MIGRLVEDQHVRLLEPRRARDQQQALPAARQSAERLVENVLRHADLVGQHVDAPQIVADAAARQGIAQHVAHRAVGETVGNVLRHAADPQAARADHLAGIRVRAAPPRHFSRVDLPAPFSPTSAVRASSSRNDTFSKTRLEP